MSESLPVTKDTPQDSREASQNPKMFMAMATAIMTAITTIGVSFIGIVPQLRSGDSKEITRLSEQVKELQNKGVVNSSDKKMTIEGTVKSEDGKTDFKGIEVYLLPEPASNNLLTRTTDDAGVFAFKEIPAGTYSIVIRDSAYDGRSRKVLLNDSGDPLSLAWIAAKVKYRVKQGL